MFTNNEKIMAKKAEEIKEKKDKLREAIDQMNKKYGVGSIITLDNNNSLEKYEVISSGSIGFDYITLGTGGWVKGKLYELMGWEGVGKSTICGHAAAECQKTGGKVLYVDGEHALDKNYFQALGVDTSKMLIAQPSSGEEGFNIAEEMMKSGELDLVIIDSDSSLIPKAVLMDGEIGDSSIGKKAKLNSSAYPRLKNALVETKTCVLVVSQFREKIGQMFGDPKITQGGHALKYYSDGRIEITRTLAKEGDEIYGAIIKIKTIKNKMAPPYKKNAFEIIYGKGVDKYKELIELGQEYLILKKWGESITYTGTKYKISEFNTLLRDNDEFFEEIKQQLINILMHTEELPIDEISEED